MNKITDKDRLDFLQKLNDRGIYTGRCVLRQSRTGRGWRLHETGMSEDITSASVREAIDTEILKEQRE